MSGYPKILWRADVTVGWTFAWNDGAARSVAITDGTHDTILELAAHLQTRIRTIDAAATVTVSSIGIVTITIPTVVALNWGGTTNGLSSILGFDESEALVGTSVTASGQHQKGYYPGLISYGYDAGRGAGLTRSIRWEPDYHGVRVVAGNRLTRMVCPSTPQDTTTLECSLIRCDPYAGVDEWSDDEVGVRGWVDDCSADLFRLYPNRYLGTTGTPGTEGTTYYTCAFAGELRSHDGPTPKYCTWSVPVNWEFGP